MLCKHVFQPCVTTRSLTYSSIVHTDMCHVCRPDMSQLTAVLDALQALCAEGQVMVDLFVNYDCDLQAANLFERSMKGLSKLLRRAPTTAPFSSPPAAKAREVALEAVLSILKSLDKWADPLKVSYSSLGFRTTLVFFWKTSVDSVKLN